MIPPAVLVASLVAVWSDVSPADLLRFPDQQTATAAVDLATAHLEFLDAQTLLYPHLNLTNWLEDARLLLTVWTTLRDAHGWSGCSVSHLRELRRLLGEDAYAAGWMPPPVPLWRYRR